MKKSIKNKAIAILACLFAIALSCSLFGMSTVHAEEVSKEQKFINNVASFVTLADTDHDGSLSADEVRAVMGTNADTYFLAMYGFINNDDTATTHLEGYAAAKANYGIILGQYNLNGAIDLYSALATRIRNIYKLTGYSYKDHEVVEGARADITHLSGTGYEKDMAFLKNSDLPKVEVSGVEEFEDIIEAEKKIAKWKKDIENAIKAIKEIQVYAGTVEANATVNVFDDIAGAYRNTADYEVLLASENSIISAESFAEIVKNNGDLSFINGTKAFVGDSTNHYKVLTDARAEVNKQKEKIVEVENAIEAAFAKYSEVAGAEVCYTIYESDIKPANDKYEALTGNDYNNDGVVDNLNNLKNGVNATKKANLDKMLDTYAAVKNAIEGTDGVQEKITAIGTVSYTNASKTLIEAARTAFDALPNDVKAESNKKEEDGSYTNANKYVNNYESLINAEKDWAKFVAEVNALINSIKALRGIEVNTPNDIFGAFVATQLLYNALSDKNNQLKGDAANGIVGVEPTALDEPFTPNGYIDAIANCKNAYEYYQTLSNQINTATKDIKTDINSLNALYAGKVRLTDDFEALYNKIVGAIDLLPKVNVIGEDGNPVLNEDGTPAQKPDPRYIGALGPDYDTFVALQTKYLGLLDLAKEWADSVVSETVSVNTFDAVAASVGKFNAIVAAYDVFAPATTAEESLKADVAAFSKVYNTKAYSAYYTTYENGIAKKADIITALENVEALANALVRPTDIADVAQNATYATEVENVTTAFIGLAGFDVAGEGYITTTKYFEDNYANAFLAYKNGLINVKANAIEEKIAAALAAGATGNLIKDARDAYNAEVTSDMFTKEDVQNAVRNAALLDEGETAARNFVDAVNALLKEAAFSNTGVYGDVDKANVVLVPVTYANVKEGFYRVHIPATESATALYNALTDVMKEYVDGDYNVAEAKAMLDKIIEIAAINDATKPNNKLQVIDKALKQYINEYTGTGVVSHDYKELKELVESLTASQIGLLDNYTDFAKIETDLEVAEQLKGAIDKLYEEVMAGKVTNETVIDYYVINSIYEGMNVSQQKLVVSAANNGDTVKTLADIKAKIDESTVIDISGALEDLKTKIDDLKEDTGADIADINTQIAGISGNIDTINSQLNALNMLLKVANAKNTIDEINEKITALEAAKTELQGKIDTLNTDLNNAKNDLQSKINAANTALETAKTELNGKIDSSKTELQGKIDALKTELEGKLDAAKAELQGKITALETAKTELEGKIAATNTELSNTKTALENKDKELEDMIKKVEKDLTEKYDGEVKSLKDTITVISVIFGILIAACAACVVVLFVKKK